MASEAAGYLVGIAAEAVPQAHDQEADWALPEEMLDELRDDGRGMLSVWAVIVGTASDALQTPHEAAMEQVLLRVRR